MSCLQHLLLLQLQQSFCLSVRSSAIVTQFRRSRITHYFGLYRRTQLTVYTVLLFPARRCARAVLAVALCLCVCLSVCHWRRQALETGRSLQVTVSARRVSGHSMLAFSKYNYTNVSQGDGQGVRFSARSCDLARPGVALPLQCLSVTSRTCCVVAQR